MGIRESVNENPAITTGVTAGIILLALVFIVYQLFSGGGAGGGGGTITQQYYTVDDGATYFEDDLGKVTPFQKDGKEAVTAYVFKCGGDPFVGYLERLDARTQAALAKMPQGAQANPESAMQLEMMKQQGREVKKPGAGKFVNANSPDGQKVTAVQCPDGGKIEDLEPYYPGM